MSLARRLMMVVALLAVLAPAAGAVVVKQERVPGGALEQTWSPGFGVGQNFTPLTLAPGDPAIPTPSGDNTVAVLTNVAIGLGGIAVSATDPSGFSDYTWEGDFFTGAGSTRVGLILRADPSDGFQTFYQLVINPGLFQVRFRKFVAGAPLPDLASWFTNILPAGVPTANSWHHLKVIAQANTFRCFFDSTELTTSPIVDASSPILGGWVGGFNFSASVGEVPVYFDNLTLSIEGAVPTHTSSWAAVKKLYR
jgi:hypothetical protein